MLKLGPITIMSSKTQQAYSGVVKAAWPLHQAIWFDQVHDYSELMPLDAVLSEALSHAPVEDAPT
jgi:hypothetical protein